MSRSESGNHRVSYRIRKAFAAGKIRIALGIFGSDHSPSFQLVTRLLTSKRARSLIKRCRCKVAFFREFYT